MYRKSIIHRLITLPSKACVDAWLKLFFIFCSGVAFDRKGSLWREFDDALALHRPHLLGPPHLLHLEEKEGGTGDADVTDGSYVMGENKKLAESLKQRRDRSDMERREEETGKEEGASEGHGDENKDIKAGSVKQEGINEKKDITVGLGFWDKLRARS